MRDCPFETTGDRPRHRTRSQRSRPDRRARTDGAATKRKQQRKGQLESFGIPSLLNVACWHPSILHCLLSAHCRVLAPCLQEHQSSSWPWRRVRVRKRMSFVCPGRQLLGEATHEGRKEGVIVDHAVSLQKEVLSLTVSFASPFLQWTPLWRSDHLLWHQHPHQQPPAIPSYTNSSTMIHSA